MYDGDEIALGLDPLNPATNGYPDGEYTTLQTVNADSDCFAYINESEGNPYTVSMEIKAAGIAENCLSTDKSGYSYQILQNEAVAGVVPVFTYKERLTVEDVVISFNLNKSETNNPGVNPMLRTFSAETESQGISKYNVFKFFEDTNMLLPIDTFYDAENNRVYTHVDELGIYCLIDMEKWLGELENAEGGDYYDTLTNIVFCLDTREIIDGQSFNKIKSDIRNLSQELLDNYNDISIYLYYQEFKDDFTVKHNMLNFNDIKAAEEALNKLKTKLIKCDFWSYDLVEASNYVIDNCGEGKILMYHITSGERVMGDIDSAGELLELVSADERISVSTLCPFEGSEISDTSFAAVLADKSGGIVFAGEPVAKEVRVMGVNLSGANSNTAQDKDMKAIAENHIKLALGDGDNKKDYIVISGTSLKPIKLNTRLNNFQNAGLDNDTDKDGIVDWDEVDTAFIEKNLKNRGKIIKSDDWMILSKDLPTIKECLEYY